MSSLGVPITSITDLIDHSLAAYDMRGSFIGGLEYQQYVFLEDLIDLNKLSIQAGKRVEWRYIFDDDGSSRYVDLFEPTDPNYATGRAMGYVDWSELEGYCTFHDTLMTLDDGDAALVDYMDDRYWRGVSSHIGKIETGALGVPDDASDTKTPKGLQYWLCYLDAGTSDTTGGFNGQTAIFGDGTTTTSIGGIDRSIQSKAKNWAATKTGINMTFVDTVRLGLLQTNWIPPKSLREYQANKKMKRRALFDHTNLSAYTRLVNSGSDDRNGDINPFRSEGVTLLGVPTRGVPVMNGMTYSPVYITDFADFGIVVHRSEFLKKKKAMRDVRFHKQSAVFIDSRFAFRLKDPRKHMVIHDPIPA